MAGLGKRPQISRRVALLAAAWLLAFFAKQLATLWFSPSLLWPHLPLVSVVPWTAEGDFHSSTPPFFAGLVLACVAVLLVELAKIVEGFEGARARHAGLVLFQATLAADTVMRAAPDWAAHGISLIVFRGAREIPFHSLPSWPWISLLFLVMLFLLESVPRSSRR